MRTLEIKILPTEKEKGAPAEFNWKERSYVFQSSEQPGTGHAAFPWGAEVKALLQRLSGHPSPVDLRRVGQVLRAFLTGGLATLTGWDAHETALRDAEKRNERIRLVIAVEAPELCALPWELTALKDDTPLGSLRCCLVQHRWLGRTDEPAEEPGRVLFGWSAAGGRVPEEAHRAVLAETVPGFQLDRDEQANLSLVGLVQALDRARQEKQPFAVLHLLCHGGVTADGLHGPVLDGGPGRAGGAVVDPLTLRHALAGHVGTLRLAVLCMCHGADPGPVGNPLGSVAVELHRTGIPLVITSRFPLTVDGSVRFTRAFYEAMLKSRQPAQEAYLAARAALDPGTRDWTSLQFHAHESAGADLRPFERPERKHLVSRSRPVRFTGQGDLPRSAQSDVAILFQVNRNIPDVQARAALDREVRDEACAVVLQPFEETGENLPDSEGWPAAFAAVDRFDKALLAREAEVGDSPRYHLFGCAPLSLMLYLGHRLCRRPLRAYQQPPGGESWWLGYARDLQPPAWTEPFFQEPRWPEPAELARAGSVAVTVEVSLFIEEAHLPAAPADAGPRPVVRLRAARGPGKDAFRGQADAACAVEQLRHVLDRLHGALPLGREIHLFLACPASLAVALGAAINPKAQPSLVLYNYNFRLKDHGYVLVHRIA